jgi:pimeloyl-ACP methyl ester carboxylesterase
MKRVPRSATTGLPTKLIAIAMLGAALVSTAAAATYNSPTGQSRTWNLNVDPGTHTFGVDGITSYAETRWYADGLFQETDISQWSNGYWDPSLDCTFTNGTNRIEAKVYNSGGTLLETHTWNITATRILAAYWWMPMDVSDGDEVTLCAEVEGPAVGTQGTFQVFEDDGILLPDDPVWPTVTGTVYAAEGGKTYVQGTWAAQWTDDQSGDPEYYFRVSFGGVSLQSSRSSDEEVIVRNDRQQPSPAHGDFYYDPGPAAGEATRKAALTDDRIPLILVHGMSGDMKIDSLNYWYGWANADLAPAGSQLGRFNEADLKYRFRVYRYVYDSRRHVGSNGIALATFVKQFCATNADFAERQVVIMAHSMGGVVARHALNTDSEFRSKVHRLVTLGSPHLGSPGANPTWIFWSQPGNPLSSFVGMMNNFLIHENTEGFFDLAWHNVNEIPSAARSQPTLFAYHSLYHDTLLDQSLSAPFCGSPEMQGTSGDGQIIAYGGSFDSSIDGAGEDWPETVAEEVGSDHWKLWLGKGIMEDMTKENLMPIGSNDGLVPEESALLGSGHPAADKINLTQIQGEPIDHCSYLDVASTMDYIVQRLLTMAKVTISPPEAIAAGARWRIAGGAWQKSTVSLNALKPGQYTIEFKDVPNWAKPADQVLTIVANETTALSGSAATYTRSQGRFASCVRGSDEHWHLTLQGEPANCIEIFASSNLVDWIPIGIVTNAIGTVEFVDARGVNWKQCFYKARIP